MEPANKSPPPPPPRLSVLSSHETSSKVLLSSNIQGLQLCPQSPIFPHHHSLGCEQSPNPTLYVTFAKYLLGTALSSKVPVRAGIWTKRNTRGSLQSPLPLSPHHTAASLPPTLRHECIHALWFPRIRESPSSHRLRSSLNRAASSRGIGGNQILPKACEVIPNILLNPVSGSKRRSWPGNQKV